MTTFTSISFMLLATILAGMWIYLQWRSVPDDIVLSSAAKIIRLKDKIINKKSKLLNLIHSSQNSKHNITAQRKIEKEITVLERKLIQIERDKYANKNPIPYSGLQLIRMLKLNSTNKYYRKLQKTVSEIYGETNSAVLTKNLVSEGFSYLMLGLICVLVLAVLIMETGQPKKGILVGLVGSLIAFIAVYTLFDNVFYRVKKRREELLLDFPQVVTKLTLLVNAGTELTEAWRLTAYSGYRLLYFEMQTVCRALDNGISLKNSYKDFIDRCNVKDITKLGVAIEQAHVKGNSEIAKSLMSLSEVVWEERKHRARRMGELINSKLLVPILMIFCGIMMLVIVPIITNLGI